MFGVEHRIKAGKYLFAGNFSDYDVIKIIASGKSNLLVTVTIPEGLTIRQIASIFHRGSEPTRRNSQTLHLKIRRLRLWAFHQKIWKAISSHKHTISIMIPTPKEVLERMVDEFDNFFGDSLRERAARMGVSISEVMKMASIVETEAE